MTLHTRTTLSSVGQLQLSCELSLSWDVALRSASAFISCGGSKPVENRLASSTVINHSEKYGNGEKEKHSFGDQWKQVLCGLRQLLVSCAQTGVCRRLVASQREENWSQERLRADVVRRLSMYWLMLGCAWRSTSRRAVIRLMSMYCCYDVD